ncbi:MAG TPA: rhodanese-like domain-containing protein [Alphaproteobacteria bacterium]|nr:rhodanese-like domain-containing protein [Alphaproteobacteria bacterium]
MSRRRVGSLGATVVFALSPFPAFAIPAPDLIISSVSSLSQMFALLSVVLGGGALVGSRWAGGDDDGASRRRIRRLKIVVLCALGLLVVSVGMNVWQWQERAGERADRLQATLVRPTQERGRPVLDPNIRDISFRNQVKDPLSISTDQLVDLLAAKAAGHADDYVFIDVREKVEAAMGQVPGFTYTRFPDFMKKVRDGELDLKGKTAIVLCHNGNRSHEAAEDMAAAGYSAKFIAGGFEKWLTENRPTTGVDASKIKTLRTVPPYRNSETLLDTPEVKDLIANANALFLDIRYEGEYAWWHLPDAVNINMRPMPSAELDARIRELPHRPIIIPCYNRRSCFSAQVMGYELTQAGYEFLGRYTVPWEYYEKPQVQAELPHVARWEAERNRTILDRVAASVAAVVGWVAERAGTLLAGIVLLAVVMRLLVLPITLKSERDQIRMTAIKGEIAALKARLAQDPPRLARAIRALYSRNGLTPARNLLALLFLPLFLVSIAALDRAAAARPEGFLWMKDVAVPDATMVLPALFAALIALYIERTLDLAGRKRLLLWIVGTPLLGFAMTPLSAAGNLYAVISAALILLQRAWLARGRARRGAANGPIVPLAHAHLVPGTGMKASRLGQLIEAGFPVPRGVVLRGSSSVAEG